MTKIRLPGNYSKRTCEIIQENMEYQTDLSLHVEYKVFEHLEYCTLYVSTALTGFDEQDLADEVMSYLVGELAKAWASQDK